jgi:hypothetical protein
LAACLNATTIREINKAPTPRTIKSIFTSVYISITG